MPLLMTGMHSCGKGYYVLRLGKLHFSSETVDLNGHASLRKPSFRGWGYDTNEYQYILHTKSADEH